MTYKCIDMVLPEPITEHEAHERWKSRWASELAQLNRYRKKIVVRYE